MTRTASFAVAVSLLSLGGPAHAQQLISPPLWTDQGTAGACYVRNIGTTPFAVIVKLFSNNGGDIGDMNTCNTGPLGAGKTCSVFATTLPADSWAACSARASNINVSKLRGHMDVRHIATGGAKVVVGEDLR